jgi:uncharacterized protein (DUF362 family)
MNQSVYLYKSERNDKAINDTVQKIFQNITINKDIDRVYIKPNLCYYWKASTGYTTDPMLVSSIIDNLRIFYGDVDINIVEADASGMRTKYAFIMLGYKKLAEKKNVGLINLSEVDQIKRKLNIANKEINYSVPRILTEPNILINVPKFKVMKQTHLTCALKNIFGCISEPRKIKYHKYLDEAIVGINKIIKTDLVIVDGLVALSHHPFYMNMILAGNSAYSVDYTAAKIMGYDPNSINFLKIAERNELGASKNIKMMGEPISEFRFPKVNNLYSRYSFSLLLRMLGIYAKIVGDVIPPMLEGE